MKKVLILSYFFPPCNLPSSQRVGSWAKYFHKYGIHPIIITRVWDHEVKGLDDTIIPSKKEPYCEKNQTSTIYYTRYQGSYLINKLGHIKWLRKILTLITLVLQPFIEYFNPYSEIRKKAEAVIQEEEIEGVIISGNPFILFKYGYCFKKKYNIKWIADYRDAWTSSTINTFRKKGVWKFIDRLENKLEKKWVSTAESVTASSQPISDSITKMCNVEKGIAIYNGYEPEDYKSYLNLSLYKSFTITYSGTLYKGQNIEIFLQGFKLFLEALDYPNDIKLLFPGLAFHKDQEDRVLNFDQSIQSYITCSDRVPRQEVLEIQAKSHVLLYVAWSQHEGIIGSKVYEYIGLNKQVLVSPGDNSEIDKIMCEYPNGKIGNTSMEIKNILNKLYQNSKNSNEATVNQILNYTREFQASNMVELIQEL